MSAPTVPTLVGHAGEWWARCTCGWGSSSDHDRHLWQLAQQHHHWVDDPPELEWGYTCGCGWIAHSQLIRSELLAAVTHHRKRAEHLAAQRRPSWWNDAPDRSR